MKLLIIGDIGIIFTYEYVTEIVSKFPDCSVDILSFASQKKANAEREERLHALGCNIFYQPQYKFFKLHRILYVFIRFCEAIRYRICRKYDIINIHFPGVDSVAVCRYASKRTRVITSLYGSEVLRARKRSLNVIGRLLMRSDAVTVASGYIKEQVSEKFGARFDDKVQIVRYGSNAAAIMSDIIAKYTKTECKECFAFPKERITVLCGYNGSRAQRHMEILNELKKLPQAVQMKMFLVFQCSYGFDESYSKELSVGLDESSLEGVIITDFMQGEILAKFRNSIDVFLNLQPTDVLSATMIEELESGAIVVKGDWLCYPDLSERNIYMRSIPSINDLSAEMKYVIENYSIESKRAEKNKGIWEILSWKKQYENWKKVICDEK